MEQQAIADQSEQVVPMLRAAPAKSRRGSLKAAQLMDPNARTNCKNDTNETREYIAFDAADSKGRAVGASIRRGVHTYVPVSDSGPTWFHRIKPGTYFYFRPWATRDGKEYGAVQPARYFATEADREEGVAQYLAEARKRADKKSAA